MTFSLGCLPAASQQASTRHLPKPLKIMFALSSINCYEVEALKMVNGRRANLLICRSSIDGPIRHSLFTLFSFQSMILFPSSFQVAAVFKKKHRLFFMVLFCKGRKYYVVVIELLPELLPTLSPWLGKALCLRSLLWYSTMDSVCMVTCYFIGVKIK